MSQDNVVYPMPARSLSAAHDRRWQVQEDRDDQTDDQDDRLLDLTDIIQGKLSTAEALAWVLHGSEHHPSGAEKVTAGVIAELIHEAAEAYDRQWEMIRQFRQRNV